MVVLITGGAGFLGINLARHLRDRGVSARLLDLSRNGPGLAGTSYFSGDVRDRATCDRACAGVTAVVHCAAALPLATPQEIKSVNVDGTRTLLAAAAAAGVERVVHISSTAVYGVPDHHPLREDDRLQGVGPYGEAKILSERVCDEFRAGGACVPVLRPKTFIGPERLGVFELLYDFAYTGHGFPVLGRGTNLYQFLDVEDLCQAIWLCLSGDRAVVNDVFNVGAARFGRLRDSFQAVLDRAGHGKRVTSIPAGPAIWTLRTLERFGLSPLYQWIYETAARDSWVDIERITGRLGFAPAYSNEDALVRNYDWYVAHRERLSRQTGLTHRVPWKKGVLGLAKLFV